MLPVQNQRISFGTGNGTGKLSLNWRRFSKLLTLLKSYVITYRLDICLESGKKVSRAAKCLSSIQTYVLWSSTRMISVVVTPVSSTISQRQTHLILLLGLQQELFLVLTLSLIALLEVRENPVLPSDLYMRKKRN